MPRHPSLPHLSPSLLAAGLLGGCVGSPPSPSTSPEMTATASAPITSRSPSPSTSPVAVIVTFRAADGSTWKMEIPRASDIAIARDLLAGRPGPGIPNGRIVRGSPDVNVGWSWHLDPTDFAWADMATEVCDGNPKSVEDGSLTSDRYCPWSATVIAVDPAP